MNTQKDQDLVHAIVHVAANEVLSTSEGKAQIDTADLRQKIETFVEKMEAVQKQELLSRLRLYQMTIGRDFSRELNNGQTEAALGLRTLRAEIKKFVIDILDQNGIPNVSIFNTRAAVQNILMDGKSGKQKNINEEILYEEIVENDAAAFAAGKKVLGMEKAKKWNELTESFFTKPSNAEKLIHASGYVSRHLYSSAVFRELIKPPTREKTHIVQKISFSHFAHMHAGLKAAQEQEELKKDGNGVHRGRLLRARAQLLQQIFLNEEHGALNEKMEKAKGRVSVDINGLWINLTVTEKGKEKARLDSHLPYIYATDEVLAAMEKNGWITEFDVTEARLRRAEALNDPLLKEQCEKEKLFQFMLESGKFSAEECSGKTMEELEVMMDKKFFWYDWKLKIDGASSFAHSPIPTLLRQVAKGPYPEMKKDKGLFVARGVAYAQSIQLALSGKNEKDHEGQHDFYGRLTKKSGDRQDVGRDILQDPRNYDAAKIAGAILDALPDFPKQGIRHSIFRGPMEKKEDGTEKPSFLAAANEYGYLAKVLLLPGKQLSRNQREIFESLPELSRSDTELYEALVRSHSYARVAASGLREMAGARGSDLSGDGQREAIEYYTQKMNLFLCMEFPEKYTEALQMRRNLMRDEYRNYNWPPWEYEQLCQKAIDAFAKKIFTQDPRSVVADVQTEISRKEVQFDENFIQSCANELEDRWDPEFSRQLHMEHQSVHVVYGEKEDQHISFVLEAKAIRALGVQLDRPLIQVIGGCRLMADGGAGGNLAETMSNTIVAAADKLKANVVPPGTQSGIGTAMGKAAQVYRNKTAGLASQDCAQFFAVSPGGQTFFPGNPLLSKDPAMLAYAIGPFNTLLTPFLGWAQNENNEFLHFKYAEAIYHRVSAGQPRITVVGNGGLLTVVESIAALENNSSMVLVRDMGRFADLAIALRDISYNDRLSMQDWERTVIELIQAKIPAHSKNSLLREFGDTIPAATPAQETYREQVHHFFHLMQGRSNIRVADVSTLEATIEEMAEAQRTKNARRNR